MVNIYMDTGPAESCQRGQAKDKFLGTVLALMGGISAVGIAAIVVLKIFVI